IFGRGFMSPRPSNSRYHGIRRTPWESTPRRFAHTSTSASRAASSDGTPAAMNTPFVKSRRSAAGIRVSSAMGAPRSGGGGGGVRAGMEESRRRRAEGEAAEATAGVKEEDPTPQEPRHPARGVLERQEGLRRVHRVEQEPVAGGARDDRQLRGPDARPSITLVPVEESNRAPLDVHVCANPRRGLPHGLPDGGPNGLGVELDRHAPDLGCK